MSDNGVEVNTTADPPFVDLTARLTPAGVASWEAIGELAQAGHPLADRIHANDLWVAASAIHIGAELVTADGVFAEAPGLTVVE